MKRATYLCTIGCLEECSHGLECVVYITDIDHPHPVRHIGFDDNAKTVHEWRSGRKVRRCTVTAQEPLR